MTAQIVCAAGSSSGGTRQHPRRLSGSSDHFEDSLSDQFGVIKMDPVSAANRCRPHEESCAKSRQSQVGFLERSRLAFVEEGIFGPLGSNRPSPALSGGAFHLFL